MQGTEWPLQKRTEGFVEAARILGGQGVARIAKRLALAAS
jgi:hypothetical protein